MSRPLLIDSLVATVAVFILCFLLRLVVFNIEFLNPVHSAIHHVEQEFDNHVHAVIPARMGEQYQPQIALVDIDTASRARLGQILTLIDQQKPNLVGVDIVFDKKNAPADTSLRNALRRLALQKKLVMASWLSVEKTEEGKETDTLYQSEPFFRFGPVGYTNFVSDEEEGVVRHHLPIFRSAGNKPNESRSFAAQIVSQTDPDIWSRYQKHLAAQPDEAAERIIYQKDTARFSRFNENELNPENPRLSQLQGKIVLLGSLADVNDAYQPEDVHRVPGGENARMNGLYIHANIIAMLLQGNYTRTVPNWVLWMLSFPLCWGIIVFVCVYQTRLKFFHLVFKGVQFVLSALFVFVSLVLFHKAGIEMKTLPLIVPIALSVDVLYFYEPFAQSAEAWLKRQKGLRKHISYKTYFKQHHAH